MRRLPFTMRNNYVSGMMVFVFALFYCFPKKGMCNDLLLVRHGEAMNNVHQFFSTNANNPGYRVSNLTPIGQLQVKKMARKLRNLGYNQRSVSRIVYSPLPRTRQTAEILAAELGIPASRLKPDHRIQDMNAGYFEGKTTKNMPKHDMSQMLSKIVSMGGEKPEDVLQRVICAHRDVLDHQKGKGHVIMITHQRPASLFLEKIREDKTMLARGGYNILNQHALMNSLSSVSL